MTDPLVELSDLEKHFSTKEGTLKAVDGVSLQIRQGETLGLVGESGCGKSTTGKLLVRLLAPTAGRILYRGRDITSLKTAQEAREFSRTVQMVFQDPYSSLDPRMSVGEIIEEPLRVHRLFPGRRERQQRIRELMEYAGIAPRLINSYPHELDGGRRQRVGIARALALNPEFLVLDEPVSALDVSIQAQIINLFETLQRELSLTYLFIAHDLSVVHHVSTRIAVMYMGEIVEMGSADEVIRSPRHPYTEALVSAIPRVKNRGNHKRIILQGDVPSPVDPPPICRFYGRCPKGQDQCRRPVELLENSSNRLVRCILEEQ
ncbi:peptide/nickel transport system ATP-binding protein/oligopeptide transport system ATP-binding protein [Alkalispirochaeta americana]|uniref:Peptide/nickel transport system ATP-binding protein/oligopeptide transport system ATP-binding protein n=1 Tax=Alkalispirochaeta americana TaxID=159291 RepID=A0A1N6QER4_9SPIO|nr:ABC transporter ATP-binding protein [Alkalispirochaeta americana]SIQ15028.1 peptide/nickel transport system ATP-binding protein/oligopeptide transport system ATP-binding protein [Alkalispirochaeta americana]